MQNVAQPFLSEGTTIFFLCDMQERFRNAISHFPEIVETSSRLVKASNILDLPLIVTEQCPAKLGKTVQEIDISHIPVHHVFSKEDFTMCIPPVKELLHSMPEKRVIVLFGIEAHICVEQTAIDLRGMDYEVHVVADGSSSRSQEDRLLAFERLRQCGCFVTTHEAVLFRLLKSTRHPHFKAIQQLIMKLNKPTEIAGSV